MRIRIPSNLIRLYSVINDKLSLETYTHLLVSFINLLPLSVPADKQEGGGLRNVSIRHCVQE